MRQVLTVFIKGNSLCSDKMNKLSQDTIQLIN